MNRSKNYKALTSVIILSLALLYSPGYIAARISNGEGITRVTKAIRVSPERIFIGVVPWMGHAPWVVAEEKGFLRRMTLFSF
jgi:ABC-type nitrate/sulfonate/bicarbonate transport system substrate-binding protein